jgi:hypothetical protein
MANEADPAAMLHVARVILDGKDPVEFTAATPHLLNTAIAAWCRAYWKDRRRYGHDDFPATAPQDDAGRSASTSTNSTARASNRPSSTSSRSPTPARCPRSSSARRMRASTRSRSQSSSSELRSAERDAESRGTGAVNGQGIRNDTKHHTR